MSSKEIAQWLNISYSTYKRQSYKYLEKLKDYCEFTRIHGGVIISKIIIDEYYGNLSKQIIQDYLEEISSGKNTLSSIAGMTRKFQKYKQEYKNISFSTLQYQLGKTGKICFGKTNYSPYIEHQGAYGYRQAIWGIKLNDFNEYRYLTEEEQKDLNKIITNFYKNEQNPNNIMQIGLLEDAFKNGEITKEEYFQYQENMNLDFFSQCIQQFNEKHHCILARVQQHYIKELEEKVW